MKKAGARCVSLAVIGLAVFAGAGRQVWALSCGELRLMNASGVIGAKHSYTLSAACGEEHFTEHGKMTWTGYEHGATNNSISFSAVGKASWERATGVATEALKFTGHVTGNRIVKAICNQDPFLKDPPGGPAKCQSFEPEYQAISGPTYEFFIQPRFFMTRTIALAEAEALSQQNAGKSSNPPPPPPAPVHKTMKSPSGAQMWEGEELVRMHHASVNGGLLDAQPMEPFGPQWSGNSQLLWVRGRTGAVLDLRVDVKSAGDYRAHLALTKGPDYGMIQAEVDGKATPLKFDGFSGTVTREEPVELGIFKLAPGPRNITLMIIGKNSQSTGYLVGVDRVMLTPVRP